MNPKPLTLKSCTKPLTLKSYTLKREGEGNAPMNACSLAVSMDPVLGGAGPEHKAESKRLPLEAAGDLFHG